MNHVGPDTVCMNKFDDESDIDWLRSLRYAF